MCNYFSCIVTRTLKVLWLDNSVRHEDIIEKHKLKDDKLENRDFIRIEINPNDLTKVTRNRKDWNFKVDEQSTLPEWFEKQKKLAEVNCWLAWEESILVNLAIDKEKIEAKNKLVFAYGSATVKASGSATVEASDSATVEASGSATVEASGSATVKASGSATVEAYGSATVKASGSATVKASYSATVKASGSATVKAYGSATVEASGSATVTASDSATVTAYGSATVIKSVWASDKQKTTIKSKDVIVIENGDTRTVKISKKTKVVYVD